MFGTTYASGHLVIYHQCLNLRKKAIYFMSAEDILQVHQVEVMAHTCISVCTKAGHLNP